MIRLLLITLSIVLSQVGFSQKNIVATDDLLIIVFTEEDDSVLKMYTYPPKSAMTLLDSNGEILEASQKTENFFETEEAKEILVYPSYTKNPIRLQTDGLKMQAFTSKQTARENGIRYFWHEQNRKRSYASSDDLSISYKEVIPSEKNEGTKNTKVIFTNGVQFEYTDGITLATLHGEELKIEGKYIISLPNGFLKMSYNPKNAKIWYVFTKE